MSPWITSTSISKISVRPRRQDFMTQRMATNLLNLVFSLLLSRRIKEESWRGRRTPTPVCTILTSPSVLTCKTSTSEASTSSSPIRIPHRAATTRETPLRRKGPVQRSYRMRRRRIRLRHHEGSQDPGITTTI